MKWTSVVDADGEPERTTITRTRFRLTQFEVSEPEAARDGIGTTVLMERLEPEPAAALLADDASDKLTAMLAPYLERYPDVKITFRGHPLDPAPRQAHRANYKVEIPDNEYGPLTLTVIEWNRRFPRELLLCDENGITLHVEPPGIQAPAFDFTAYASWRGFREHEPELVTTELHPVLAPVLEAVRRQMRSTFDSEGLNSRRP